MDFLCLLSCGGLTCTDSPDWLVGNNDVLELLGCEVEYTTLELCLANLVLLVGLTLVKALADAEDNLQTVLQCQQHLLLENLGSLLVIFTAL